MPADKSIKKTLILGSGAVRIGQAGEFDYSGSQALKALKEEGIKTVLINPNVATIQTDPRLADRVYLMPLTKRYIEEIIREERPDSVLLGFGGQSALNAGISLWEDGTFEKHGIRVLGTSVESIQKTEDRELFKQVMEKAEVKTLKSRTVHTFEEARDVAESLGYPVMVRPAYTLGGKGSGVAYDENELETVATKGLSLSLIGQVLIEEYVGGWKEIEYEVVRDADDNCICICNMENFDPMGIHTGDSIVVCPSQTLTNEEYHMLRSVSIRAVREAGIVGECNIQYALDPSSTEYRVIEINPRLSRSSALASKATGYPLAYIAAKLSVGYSLTELVNGVTGKTTACFEPAIDYITIKMPRWDLQKFEGVSEVLGSQMKSVGEVMAIGTCFEEALQKAVRMLDVGKKGIVSSFGRNLPKKDLLERCRVPTPTRIFYIVSALRKGISVDEIAELSRIDSFFLYKIKNIVDFYTHLKDIKNENVNLSQDELKALLRGAKLLGFNDRQIGETLNRGENEVWELRTGWGIVPWVRQIDTLAAEWPATTNYLYMTYGAQEDDVEFDAQSKAIVLGSGVYRIGSSVEFDWCAVNMIWGLKDQGMEEVISINCNPETVSTDYDISDKLYFEELTYERVLDIYEKEQPKGIVLGVGGQTSNNLAPYLVKRSGVKILGTTPHDIDRAEDRSKFSKLMDTLELKQPEWTVATSFEEALEFVKKVSLPVLVRPSYVLSGAAMKVADTEKELEEYISNAVKVSKRYPVVVSKFFDNAREIEIDGVSNGKGDMIGFILEHVDPAGVHSGDATVVTPSGKLSEKLRKDLHDYSKKIVGALNIKGPFNIQYLVTSDDSVFIIECNSRSSRSMPFVSKVYGINLMEEAAKVVLDTDDLVENPPPIRDHIKKGVKFPKFSFVRLSGAKPVTGVEMMSTGEVASIGDDFHDAFKKAMFSANPHLDKESLGICILCNNEKQVPFLVHIAQELSGFGANLYTIPKHSWIFEDSHIDCTVLEEGKGKGSFSRAVSDRKIDALIDIPWYSNGNAENCMFNEPYYATFAAGFDAFIITNMNMAKAFAHTLNRTNESKVTIDYLKNYTNI
ncbi:MAG TPA: carbamoyl-phosphate synthase (glutamine-hydrolyzing) large subunit [Candidatus Methanofastidiosa archaeon]|nr:carbamoyl-phosphate synthase (glutamine-hydrolyzing) large subunit [Candidatus Methanofastidiosa archaeon]